MTSSNLTRAIGRAGNFTECEGHNEWMDTPTQTGRKTGEVRVAVVGGGGGEAQSHRQTCVFLKLIKYLHCSTLHLAVSCEVRNNMVSLFYEILNTQHMYNYAQLCTLCQELVTARYLHDVNVCSLKYLKSKCTLIMQAIQRKFHIII